jgi:hypothetical protein
VVIAPARTRRLLDEYARQSRDPSTSRLWWT